MVYPAPGPEHGGRRTGPEPDPPPSRRSGPGGAPAAQQSPNGLYQLSITDTGIELRGPKGTVLINDAGITIGGPGTQQVTIASGNMDARIDRDVTYRVGANFNLDATSNVHMRAGGTSDIWARGAATVTGFRLSLGCLSGKPAARLGDQVNSTNAATPFIAQGSSSVLIC